MTNLHKVLGFLLIFSLICQVYSDHQEGTLNQLDKPLNMDQFEKFIQQGFPVIDLRHLPQNGIIKGAYWVSQNGNIGQMTSFVISPEEKYVVVTEEPKRIQNLKKLVQAGFKNMLGYNAFDMKEWTQNLKKAEVKAFQELNKSINQAFIDVRTRPQLKETGIFQGALWVPIHQFSKRLDEVEEFMKKNKDSQIVVHCKMSPRARLAASMMMGKGLGPITVLNENIDRLRDKLVPFDDQL